MSEIDERAVTDPFAPRHGIMTDPQSFGTLAPGEQHPDAGAEAPDNVPTRAPGDLPLEHDGAAQSFAVNEPVPDGSIDEVMHWVGDDSARAQQALVAEQTSERPRKSLMSRLESHINVLEANVADAANTDNAGNISATESDKD